MCWSFRGKGEEDACSVVDSLPREETPRTPVRGLVGEEAPSSGGFQYLVMIVDDFSRFGRTYFLKKSDVPAVFGKFLADIRALGSPSAVKFLRSDNDTEFTKAEFVTLLDRLCIRRQHTPVNSPKHVGVVERRVAVTLELGMASYLEAPRLLGGVPLPPTGSLSAEACAFASDVLNITARVTDRPHMFSPYQKIYSRAPFP